MSVFSGLSAFTITPADEAGVVDTDALGRHLDMLVRPGIASIGLLGSTGTYAYLSASERRRSVEAAAAALDGRAPLVVGIGAMRTDAVIGHARHAEAAGADGLLLAPVSYTPLTQNEVFAHFKAVSEATALPLCIYNNPGTTHFTFSDALLGSLAAVPGIEGVKMPLPVSGSVSEEIARLRPQLPDSFVLGYSNDCGMRAALSGGADAFFSAIAGFLPEPFLQMAAAIAADDHSETDRIDAALAPLLELCARYGSLRLIYAIGQKLGLITAELPRPLLPLPAEAHAPLDTALASLSDQGLI
ncbi:dihydrodipicolinate synthase family protein [Poseidonocella sedimentorum]|uniref:4-hydroxy-tetrahydrodipicolinate synthase n=1 Tax=Poseidonocella sedimentorum TaxID=871652 RepID=A0A1I6CRC2_9RHOB|nr:dihydrodipicolinate synthase family protein [Poseidonocella sedimentorum]SFQ95766.1 4-hydroxy-tetrahydrodipicolinate synthase [Poseidonocella sedimentorum]